MEDDYMSNEILEQCESVAPRPGLIHTKPLKREHEQYKKKLHNAKKYRPLKEIEEERRDEGLKTAIPEDNIGFKLLQKMGYQTGNGLGKDSKGLAKPITIKMKSGHSGLGKEKHEEEKYSLRIKKNDVSSAQYRTIICQKNEMRVMLADFERSQRTCMNLDKKNSSKATPSVKWYWPKAETKKLLDNTSDDNTSESDEEAETYDEIQCQLEELTQYLRNSYNYCMWCGCEYSSTQEMNETCPGPGRKTHDEN